MVCGELDLLGGTRVRRLGPAAHLGAAAYDPGEASSVQRQDAERCYRDYPGSNPLPTLAPIDPSWDGLSWDRFPAPRP